MRQLEGIAASIRTARAQRVILSPDLAALYGVDTRVLTQAVRRNSGRFPADFMFRLSKHEVANLKSQIVTSSWGGARKPPLAFTEHGALMAATVLSSPRAIEISLHVIRAFIAMRQVVRAEGEIRKRLDELGRKVGTHDRSIAHIIEALRQLATPPDPPKRRRIGFL